MRIRDLIKIHENWMEVHKGETFDDEDTYKKIKEEYGVDIKNLNWWRKRKYRIGYEGASDNNGISETFTTEYVLFKKGLPHIELHLPELHFSMPHLNLPEFNIKFPNIKLRKINLKFPNVRLPKFNMPHFKSHENHIQPENVIQTTDTLKPDDVVLQPENFVINQSQVSNMPLDIPVTNKNYYRVTNKVKNRLSIILASAALATAFAAPWAFVDKVNAEFSSVGTYEQVDNNKLNYEYILDYTYDDIISDINMGDSLYLNYGTSLYRDSEKNGKEYIIGTGKYRKEGNYEITGFSIVVNGRYATAVTNLTGKNKNINLGEFVNNYCKRNNLSVDDIEIMLHFGNDYDNTRIGWVPCEEVLGQVIVNKATNFKGTIDNLDANTNYITLDNGVNIPIKDDNGNYYQAGDIVVGSDGNRYKICEFNLVETNVNNSINGVSNETKVCKKLSFSVDNISLFEYALFSSLVAATAASIIATHKKNKELSKEPIFDTANSPYGILMTEKEQKDYISFPDNVGKFFYDEYSELRELDPDQINALYMAIQTLDSEKYKYSPTDKIQPPKDGRFYVLRIDGSIVDITIPLLEKIEELARRNDVVAKGELKRYKEISYMWIQCDRQLEEYRRKM